VRKQGLLVTNPKLAGEWHLTNNGKLTPSDVTAGSYKKAWWICPKDRDHEWQANIASRNKGSGCPYCSGRNASKSNNLAISNPELASQWHPTKNDKLTPADVTAGSDKKAWWKCPKGSDHEWDAKVQERSRGNGCPICSGKRVVKSNSLAFINPELSKQWHPTKNGTLTPWDVIAGSGKIVWWQCHEGSDHEWQAIIAGRNRGIGCPYCSGNKPSKSNSLATLNPELAKQWNPTKNGTLTPSDVTLVSGKKVWWKCPRCSDHEWQATIANRNKGSGCPFCSGHRASSSNNLGTINSKLAKEWHPTKNKGLTPFDVLPSSNKMIWWQCATNPNHEWKAQLSNRANGRGCPICSNQIIVRENSLGATNPFLAEQWHPTKNERLTPFDVAPSASRKVWWKCPKGDDHVWKATINHRATGTGCPKCNPVWSVPELRIYSELKTLFPTIQHRAVLKGHEVDIYIPEIMVGIEYDGVYWHEDKLEKDKEKNAGLGSSILLIRIREEGLPLLSSNDINVKKRKISVSTIKRILNIILEQKTLSSEGTKNVREYLNNKSWVATKLFNKLYSERKTVKFEESLHHLFPGLTKEWHPTKNDVLLPEQFTPGSGRKIWWLGKCGHDWQDTINHRTSGRDCPKCRYKKASRTRKNNSTKGQLKLL